MKVCLDCTKSPLLHPGDETSSSYNSSPQGICVPQYRTFVFTITGFMTLLVEYNIYVGFDDQKPTTSMKKSIVDAHRESGNKNSSSEILFIKFVHQGMCTTSIELESGSSCVTFRRIIPLPCLFLPPQVDYLVGNSSHVPHGKNFSRQDAPGSCLFPRLGEACSCSNRLLLTQGIDL
jgi:hypothetical protein